MGVNGCVFGSTRQLGERVDHFLRCLHQLNQHTFAGDREFIVGFRVHKGDVVTGSTLTDTAWRKTNAVVGEPFNGYRQMINP